MLTFTSTIRSVPSRRDRSMRGYCPHSVQNRYLQGPQQCDHSALRQHPLLGLEDLKPFPRQQLPPPQPPHAPRMPPTRISSPLLRVHSDGPRFVQALGDDHVAEGPVQPGHLNHIKALIRPVDVSCTEGP